jgi:hypothetical protein
MDGDESAPYPGFVYAVQDAVSGRHDTLIRAGSIYDA